MNGRSLLLAAPVDSGSIDRTSHCARPLEVMPTDSGRGGRSGGWMSKVGPARARGGSSGGTAPVSAVVAHAGLLPALLRSRVLVPALVIHLVGAAGRGVDLCVPFRRPR